MKLSKEQIVRRINNNKIKSNVGTTAKRIQKYPINLEVHIKLFSANFKLKIKVDPFP